MGNTLASCIRLLAISALISSCATGGTEKTPTPVEDNDAFIDSISKSIEATMVPDRMTISDIPFPFEILEELYSKRIPFNPAAANKPSNASKYSQYNAKALNLGVYGADLSYAVTYEQFQQIGTYIKSTKKLADELNIPIAFDNGMMDRYNKYKDNKDSLTNIVYDSYTKVDAALKDDERVGMAALVVTGSWLEGLYLSTRTFVDAEKTADNATLYKTITEQQKSLKIVVKMLEEYKSDAYFASLIKELDGITGAYDSVSSNAVMNEKQLIAIHKKVEKLRNRIVEGL